MATLKRLEALEQARGQRKVVALFPELIPVDEWGAYASGTESEYQKGLPAAVRQGGFRPPRPCRQRVVRGLRSLCVGTGDDRGRPLVMWPRILVRSNACYILGQTLLRQKRK